jgi:hypothetical protein
VLVLISAYSTVALGLREGFLSNGSPITATEDAASGSHDMNEVVLEWNIRGDSYEMKPFGDLFADEAIVVFYDKTRNRGESAVVSFDVLADPNCVVSICGTQSKWLVSSSERCFDLRVAPKSDEKNGLISGLTAAYDANRPVANKLYLKFDATNYIDSTVCHYRILTGQKKIIQSTILVK